MKRKFLLFTAGLVLALGFSSCSKDTTEDPVTDSDMQTIAMDDVAAGSLNDDIFSEINENLPSQNSIKSIRGKYQSKSSDSPIVTITPSDSTYFPLVITIDFGSGITGKNGKVFKGKINATLSIDENQQTQIFNFEFVNFSVDNYKVEGTKKVSITTSFNFETGLSRSQTIDADEVITKPNGAKIAWKSNRKSELTNGNETLLDFTDDVYTVTGYSNGVNAKGVPYTMTISNNNPLQTKGLWPYFVKGSVTVLVKNRALVLDYGDGTADNKATITINGVSKEITLSK